MSASCEWCQVQPGGFSVSAIDYLISVAAAEVRGDAPKGMTAGLLHAVAQRPTEAQELDDFQSGYVFGYGDGQVGEYRLPPAKRGAS